MNEPLGHDPIKSSARQQRCRQRHSSSARHEHHTHNTYVAGLRRRRQSLEKELKQRPDACKTLCIWVSSYMEKIRTSVPFSQSLKEQGKRYVLEFGGSSDTATRY